MSKEQSGIVNSIKKNIIYVVMLAAVLIAIFFTGGLNNPNSNSQENYSHSDQDDQVDSKSKFPVKLILAASLVGGVFIYFMISGSKEYVKDAQKEAPQKSFVNKMSKEEFNKTTQETTRREMEKLMQNPKFKKMLEEKGDNPKNWIWQTREKEKKTVYRDRESSGEEDNLSQLTISDD